MVIVVPLMCDYLPICDRLCESERRAEEYQAALVQSLANLQDMRWSS